MPGVPNYALDDYTLREKCRKLLVQWEGEQAHHPLGPKDSALFERVRKVLGADPDDTSKAEYVALADATRPPSKPATARRRKAKPKKAKRSPRSSAGIALEIGSGGFTVAGKFYELKGKPWEVLMALSRARNQTLTQEQLHNDVWKGSAVSSDTVRSAVSKARKAVQGAGAKGNPIPCLDRGKLAAWRLSVLWAIKQAD